MVVPVKNKVAGTKYWLKLSVLCDLLEMILLLWVLKQVEAAAKQEKTAFFLWLYIWWSLYTFTRMPGESYCQQFRSYFVF